jgi:hypothetical protein
MALRAAVPAVRRIYSRKTTRRILNLIQRPSGPSPTKMNGQGCMMNGIYGFIAQIVFSARFGTL